MTLFSIREAKYDAALAQDGSVVGVMEREQPFVSLHENISGEHNPIAVPLPDDLTIEQRRAVMVCLAAFGENCWKRGEDHILNQFKDIKPARAI